MSDRASRSRLFSDPSDFFEMDGRYWMKLTRRVAASVVEQCGERGVAISIVEGGIWHQPGFEARLDAIWHSEFDESPPKGEIGSNNSKALKFLTAEMPAECDTTILSVFSDRIPEEELVR